MIRRLANVADIGWVGTILFPMSEVAALEAWLVTGSLARSALPPQLSLEVRVQGLLRDVVDRHKVIRDEEPTSNFATEVLRLELLLHMPASETALGTKAPLRCLLSALRSAGLPVDLATESGISACAIV